MNKITKFIGLTLALASFCLPCQVMADHPDDVYWDSIGLPQGSQLPGDVYSSGYSYCVEDNAIALFGGEVYVARTHIFDCLSPVGYEIFVWDGVSWYNNTIETDSTVHAMIEYDGDLIAAGDFGWIDGVNVDRIARWDGADWYPLGDGVDGTIHCLAVHNGDLYVGGNFSRAGSDTAYSIARWDGSNWFPLGQGIDGTVRELASFAGELIAGGDFGMAGGSPAASIASWNGTSWNTLTSGIAGTIMALAEYGGYLYAGGGFDSAGGVQANSIARWNGSEWSTISLPTTSAYITDLILLDGNLVIGGSFSAFQMMDSTMVEANAVATWDGTEFRPKDSGLYASADVVEFVVYEGHLGASFDDYAFHDSSHSPVGVWYDSSWHVFGSWWSSGEINTVTEFEGNLVAAGDIWGRSLFQPPFIDVGWCDGTDWHGLGPDAFNGQIYSSFVYNDELYIGGRFDSIGGQAASGVAKWNSIGWEEVGGGLQFAVDPWNQWVTDFCEYNGDLYVAGSFDSAGGIEAKGLARWNGVIWQTIGSITSGWVVTDLMVYDDDLLAAGNFWEINGLEVPGIARWDGTDWHRLEGSYTTEGYSSVRALAVYDGELYLAGDFKFIILPESTVCYGIARWDGSGVNAVEPMLNGYLDDPQNVAVYALEIYHEELYVVGDFNVDGDFSSEEHIARYDGSYWRMLGSQPGTSYFSDLSVVGDVLHIVNGRDIWHYWPRGEVYTWSKPATCCVDYTGNIDGDPSDLVDIADLVYLVDFMFNDGTPPPCTPEADLDVTGTIDISDLVYLVDYMFSSGPAPMPCP